MTGSNAPVVLASGSAIRRAVLSGAGVAFESISPGVDEDAVKRAHDGALTDEVALELAVRKALAVSRLRPDALVIGADQILEFEGAPFDKVTDMDAAEARLRLLRGREHQLVGACVLARGGEIAWRHVGRSRLTMRDFSDAFLADYLAGEGDAVLSSVGCYRFEGSGAQLFARIDGDYYAILGLPLLPLLAALRDHGGLRG